MPNFIRNLFTRLAPALAFLFTRLAPALAFLFTTIGIAILAGGLIVARFLWWLADMTASPVWTIGAAILTTFAVLRLHGLVEKKAGKMTANTLLVVWIGVLVFYFPTAIWLKFTTNTLQWSGLAASVSLVAGWVIGIWGLGTWATFVFDARKKPVAGLIYLAIGVATALAYHGYLYPGLYVDVWGNPTVDVCQVDGRNPHPVPLNAGACFRHSMPRSTCDWSLLGVCLNPGDQFIRPLNLSDEGDRKIVRLWQAGGEGVGTPGTRAVVCPGLAKDGRAMPHELPAGSEGHYCPYHPRTVEPDKIVRFNGGDATHRTWGAWWDACGLDVRRSSVDDYEDCDRKAQLRGASTSGGGATPAPATTTAPTTGATPAPAHMGPIAPGTAAPNPSLPIAQSNWDKARRWAIGAWGWVTGLNLAKAEPWMGFVFGGTGFVLVLGYGLLEWAKTGHSGKFGVSCVFAPIVGAAAYVVGSMVPPWTP